jgi:hypothetical protein
MSDDPLPGKARDNSISSCLWRPYPGTCSATLRHVSTPRSTATVRVIAGILLTTALVGCRSHDENAGAAGPSPGPSPSPTFTRVVTDNGCNMHVAPIRLAPYHPPAFVSGPTPERIRTAKDSRGLRGYPRFPSVLGGLPNQGVEPRETVEGIFYLPRSVDGLTYEQVLAKGGVVVSASRVGRRFASHLPRSLTRVLIGSSSGWLYRKENTSVNWVTPDHFVMAVTAQRRPATLVELARSLAC